MCSSHVSERLSVPPISPCLSRRQQELDLGRDLSWNLSLTKDQPYLTSTRNRPGAPRKPPRQAQQFDCSQPVLIKTPVSALVTCTRHDCREIHPRLPQNFHLRCLLRFSLLLLANNFSIANFAFPSSLSYCHPLRRSKHVLRDGDLDLGFEVLQASPHPPCVRIRNISQHHIHGQLLKIDLNTGSHAYLFRR
jgi:hypothetical protein